MIVVDTSVWIDYFNGTVNPHTDWLDHEIDDEPVSLTDLILCELLQGVRLKSEFSRMRRELAPFPVFNTGGESMAVAAATYFRILRAKGHTIRKTPDCIIATFCIQEGHSLLHRDRDFDPFEQHLGLRVIHPGRGPARAHHLQ
jgi:predicted nucleic acid-binding protein